MTQDWKPAMGSVRVVIVGGGIGGLTAALALHSAGADVGVYEQAAQLGEVGAGVQLFPNSMRVLQRLGVAEEVARHAAPVTEFWSFGFDGTLTGHQIAGVDGPITSMPMYRPDLVAVLAAALPDGLLHTGHRCATVSQDEQSALVTFTDGTTVEADAVVGADGIHSTVQHHIVAPRQPMFSNMVAYRGVIPAARVPGWPWPAAMAIWGGQGKHFLAFPVRAGELLNYVASVPTDDQMRESWSAPGDPAVLAAEFAGWDPRVGELLAQVETTFRWGLYDRDPLPYWTRGRLTLLGDAAHPMLPHMGQGANQAIEDAMALATLTRGITAADVPNALIRYQHLRRDHTARVQQGSRANGLRLDSGGAITISQPRVQDYNVEAEAEAIARR